MTNEPKPNLAAPGTGLKCPKKIPPISDSETVLSYMHVTAHVSMCASVFMMVALTLERHFAICSPHAYRDIFHKHFYGRNLRL
jgi:hypothetical protein